MAEADPYAVRPSTDIWIGSSLIKGVYPPYGVQVVSISGGRTAHVRKYLLSRSGRDLTYHATAVCLTVGGNALSKPEDAETESTRLIDLATEISYGGMRVAVCTLPPRPQIDDHSNVRVVFNEFIRSRCPGLNLEVVDLEPRFYLTLGHGKKGALKMEFLDKSEEDHPLFGGIVHLSPEGAGVISSAVGAFFGAGRPRGIRRIRHKNIRLSRAEVESLP